MKEFSDSTDFMEYFKVVWYPRIGSWFSALKSLPLASQETSATIENYHSQLKTRLLNEKDGNVHQRVNWLDDKLSTKVHSYIWLDEYPGKEDLTRYWKVKSNSRSNHKGSLKKGPSRLHNIFRWFRRLTISSLPLKLSWHRLD